MEREKRGWTYEGLAKRMTDAGCPINASGLYKTEKAGRRITVNELVALSDVFHIKLADLLLPPEAVEHQELAMYAAQMKQAWVTLIVASENVAAALTAILNYQQRHPEIGNRALDMVAIPEMQAALQNLMHTLGTVDKPSGRKS